MNGKDINAFTTPGGNVYFFVGLLNKLTTDDQIAAVLAHEIGHCAARHTIKKYQAQLGYNLIGSIIFSQMRDAVREVALHQFYRSVQHRDEVYKAILDCLEQLEEELDDQLEKEYAEEDTVDEDGSKKQEQEKPKDEKEQGG